MLVSWGTVPVASTAVGRLILAVALARGTSPFGVPSSWLIGAPGVPPFTSFLTLGKLGDLVVLHLVETIAIDLRELVFDDV